MKHQHREEKDCLNCDAEVNGKFCSNCGQENLDLHDSFWHFLGHSLGHYFHFDSKFFNTVKPLFTKPGQLSIDYIEGKRTRYIPPVSLFIFISIVFFLITPLFKKADKPQHHNNSQIFTPEVYITKLNVDTNIKADFNKTIYDAEVEKFKSLDNAKQKFIIDSLTKITKKDSSNIYAKKYLKKFESIYKFNPSKIFNREDGFMDHYGSKIFFLLTPIFAFCLMLNFRKNQRFYLHHVIYTLHFQSFIFILFFIKNFFNLIDNEIFNSVIKILICVVIIIYSYKSLRLFYKRSIGRTIWKMFGLSFLYLIAFAISFAIVSAITLNLH